MKRKLPAAFDKPAPYCSKATKTARSFFLFLEATVKVVGVPFYARPHSELDSLSANFPRVVSDLGSRGVVLGELEEQDPGTPLMQVTAITEPRTRPLETRDMFRSRGDGGRRGTWGEEVPELFMSQYNLERQSSCDGAEREFTFAHAPARRPFTGGTRDGATGDCVLETESTLLGVGRESMIEGAGYEDVRCS